MKINIFANPVKAGKGESIEVKKRGS